VAAAAGLLAPGGTLLVYEWVLDEGGDTPPAVALFDLMMLVENEGGAAWTGSELTAWLQAAGLTGVELRRGSGPIAVLRATAPVPRRPPMRRAGGEARLPSGADRRPHRGGLDAPRLAASGAGRRLPARGR
jgi:hypothetical protein